jgi:hypothetical protein
VEEQMNDDNTPHMMQMQQLAGGHPTPRAGIELTYKANAGGTLLAAYCGACRIGYVERSRVAGESERWIWSLNTIQPKGGRASGIAGSEDAAKTALTGALAVWLDAAALQPKEQA